MVLAAGQTTASVPITVFGDRRREADETVVLEIVSVSGPAEVDAAARTGTVLIRDDD